MAELKWLEDLQALMEECNRQQRTGFVVQHTLAVSHFPALIRQMRPTLAQGAYRLQTANNEDCVGLKEMVLAGMGIAWLPAALVRKELAQQTLIPLTDELGRCELSISLYYRQGAQSAVL